MTPITPADDIIGTVTHQLALQLAANVVGIGRMYEEPPDGPPENGSVIFPLTRFHYSTETDGRLQVKLTFGIKYLIRRGRFNDNLVTAYQFFSALTRVLSSWPLQNLQDPNTLQTYAISVTPVDGGITQFVYAGQQYVAVNINTDVTTEFPILTS